MNMRPALIGGNKKGYETYFLTRILSVFDFFRFLFQAERLWEALSATTLTRLVGLRFLM